MRIYSDNDEAAKCQDDCLISYQDCLSLCNDSACEVECARKLSDCSYYCPCFGGCPDGCNNCLNPVCTCSDPAENNDFINCENYLKEEYISCLDNCSPSNSQCPNACNQQYNQGLVDCPCQAGCLDGCPCDHYQCDRPPYPVQAVPQD